MFDKNPKATPGDVYVAGKTAEQVIRAIAAGTAPDGALAALVARYDRKAEAREVKSAA